MNELDVIALDLSDSGTLDEHFSRKEPGDKCKITIDGIQMEATVKEVEAGKMALLNLDKEEVDETVEETTTDESEPEPVEELMAVGRAKAKPSRP
jgi:hypothetical protein